MVHATGYGRCFCAAAMALAAALAAQPGPVPPPVDAVIGTRADGVVIDGRPSEPAWQNGPWYTGFVTAGTTDAAAVQTRFAVRFDETHLLLAAVADEPRLEALRRHETERDGRIFRDDCVEFMIDPTGDRVEYIHLAVNANGALYDAQRRQGGHVHAAEWNADARAAAALGPAGFSVEVAVPLVELGLAPASAAQPWAIQVARERHAGGVLELSSYVPSGGSFHVPDTYASLRLEGADLGRFLWDVKVPVEVSVTPEADGFSFHFKALVRNATGRFRFTALTASLAAGDPPAVQTLVGGHDDGQQQVYAFRLPFSQVGPHDLTLAIADRARPDVPLSIRTQRLDLSHSPLVLRVTRPFYRNSIYATERIDSIAATVELALPEESLAGVRVDGALWTPAAGREAPRASAAATVSGARALLVLPCGDLPVGDHRLEVTARLATGESYSVAETIRRLPPVENEWRIDADLVLRRNGEPFFPYGWFSGSVADAAKLREEGVNVSLEYNAHYYPPERTLEWLDQLQLHGLYGCFYPWPSHAFMQNFSQPVSAAEEEALRERIRAFRRHPGLFAYYMWDEPELRPMLVERSDRLYAIVAEEDPYHPCIMLNDSIPGISKYRNGADILMPDPYPLFNRGGLAGRPIEYTSAFMQACREASAGRLAWWVTPQAFDYYMGGKANSRCPNLVELRNQQLQAIINGARGFLWYTYKHRYNYMELDVGMPFLGREAQRLRDAILSPELPGAVTWEADQPAHLQAALRRPGGHLVLFAVNTATVPQEGRFTVQGLGDATLQIVSENRSIEVRDGRFADHFGVYAGHVYTTDPALAQGQTLDDAQRAIEQAETARHRPGNLAYRGLGTTVTASSTGRYSGRLDTVTDGAVRGDGWTDDTWRQWPDWIEVAFPHPVPAGRVVVHTASIVAYEIQVAVDGTLVTVAEGSRRDGEPIAASWPPRLCGALRVVAKSGTGDRTGVSEIEVYAE